MQTARNCLRIVIALQGCSVHVYFIQAFCSDSKSKEICSEMARSGVMCRVSPTVEFTSRFQR